MKTALRGELGSLDVHGGLDGRATRATSQVGHHLCATKETLVPCPSCGADVCRVSHTAQAGARLSRLAS